jgi:hypothetical protein
VLVVKYKEDLEEDGEWRLRGCGWREKT